MDKEILRQARARMDDSVKGSRHKLATVRTGRASLAMFEGVMVDYYGTPTPLNQVAKLSVPEPALVVAQPFDPSTLPAIEKAVLSADLGLNPSNDGKLVRIPIPPLTEERRRELVKKVHALGEEAKTAVRHARREANDEIKARQKSGEMSEDDARRAMESVQKATDEHTGQIDELCKNKEKELMEV